MKAAARIQAAIELMAEIYHSTAPADAIVHGYMRQRRYIGAGDRREISELVYGIMRSYWLLEGILHHFWASPSDDAIQKARRHILIYLHKFKPEFSVVDLFSGEEYAPKRLTTTEHDLLGQVKEFNCEDLPEAAQLSCPDWVYNLLKANYPHNYRAILLSLQATAPLDLRVNILKSGREKVLAKLRREGYSCEPTSLSPWGIRLQERQPLKHHPLLQEGVLEVQDEGSQLIAMVCAVEPGMAVWDYCAGAGGKTLALAAMMQNKGRILATDTVAWRLKNAPQRLRRAGVHNVETRVLDEQAGKWLKRQAGKFDCVLVDAPCSGSGTWRRNPELRWRMDATGFQELLQKQQEILDKAALLVKPGGRLVYATCSLLSPENREQIEAFLKKHPQFAFYSLSYDYANNGALELNPADHQTDGFFAAVLQKSNS